MSARITRRSVLLAGAGAVGGTLMRPRGALALLRAPARAVLWQHEVGAVAPDGVTVRLGGVADLIGVQWSGAPGAALRLRFRLAGGGWSSWTSAGAHGHGPEGERPRRRHVGDPVWSGGTTAVQLRADRQLAGVTLHLIDVSGGLGARREAGRLAALAAAAPTLAGPVLNAGPGQPPIIARHAWAQGVSPPRVAPGYGAVQLAFVHHTENPNGYSRGEVPSMLRAIYAFHRYVRGWNDIGYNFVVDRFGRIFEGRAGGIHEPVVGAQAGGYNIVSTGVAMLGSFMGSPISPPARTALQRLLAWKLALHGVPAQGRVVVRVNPAGASYSRFPANARVSLRRIAGHRDGDSTDCPGNALYAELPRVRAAAARLAARPVQATLALAPPSQPPAPPQQRVLLGSLSLLDGAPLAGARVVVQVRTVTRRGEAVVETPLAEAMTDAAGHWAVPVLVDPAGRAVALRALFEGSSGRGASVSEPFEVAGAVAVSQPPSAPPPTPPAVAPPAM